MDKARQNMDKARQNMDEARQNMEKIRQNMEKAPDAALSPVGELRDNSGDSENDSRKFTLQTWCSPQLSATSVILFEKPSRLKKLPADSSGPIPVRKQKYGGQPQIQTWF